MTGTALGFSLTTSSAAGPPAADAVGLVVGNTAAALGVPLVVTDANSVSPGDPRGLVPFYLVVGLTLGGYLGATVLGLGLGTVPRDLERAACACSRSPCTRCCSLSWPRS